MFFVFSINVSFTQSKAVSKIEGITFRGPELAPIHPFMFDEIAMAHADWKYGKGSMKN
ncbi:MAG: hypothetical protein AAFP82_19180 [Bacteroidota bacterium]